MEEVQQLEIGHPNLLRAEEQESQHVKTLRVWLRDIDVELKGLMVVFESTGVNKCYFLAEHVKYLFLTLVRFIYDVRQLGYMLKPSYINFDNLVVLDGVIKFKEVEWSNSGCEFEDFIALSSFFEFQVLHEYERAIYFPPDLISFLELLKTNPVVKEDLIKHHYALMLETQRQEFLEKCWHICRSSEKIPYKLKDLKKAYTDLDRKNNWRAQIKNLGNPYLTEVYDQGRNLGYYRKGYGVELFDFIRNVLVHLLDQDKQGINNRWKQRCVMLLAAALPNIIPRIQEVLYRWDIITLDTFGPYFHETSQPSI